MMMLELPRLATNTKNSKMYCSCQAMVDVGYGNVPIEETVKVMCEGGMLVHLDAGCQVDARPKHVFQQYVSYKICKIQNSHLLLIQSIKCDPPFSESRHYGYCTRYGYPSGEDMAHSLIPLHLTFFKGPNLNMIQKYMLHILTNRILVSSIFRCICDQCKL